MIWQWMIVLAIGCAHAAQPPPTPVPVYGSVQGVVSTTVTNEHLKGVRVTVTSPTLGQHRQVLTDEDGVYRVVHLPPGDDYRVSFAYRSEMANHDNVQVTADRVTPVYQKLDGNRSPPANGVPWCDDLSGAAYPTVCFP